MLCLQLKPTVIRKKKSILLGSYGSPDSDGAMQGQILQLAKVRYEREADFRSLRKLPFREVAVHKSPVKEGMVAHSINFASIFSQTGRYRLPISFVG